MKALVIAPHPDDEILGVGATMSKHANLGDEVYVCIVTKGVEPLFCENRVSIVREEAKLAHKLLGVTQTLYLDFPAVMLENVNRYEINNKILEIINEVKPTILYIPHFGDMQKDHKIVAEATMVAVRPKYEHKVKKIYAYETLSETEWNIPHNSNTFIPNVYNDVSDYLETKLEAMKCYNSQVIDFPNPRSLKAIVALARYRGSTINVLAAEAFMLIREIK